MERADCPYMHHQLDIHGVTIKPHRVWVKDGQYLFHYIMPGTGMVCPSSGEPVE